MYRIINTIIALNIAITCFAQTSDGNLAGVYGKCKNIYSCFQLKLNKDQSFDYYINEYVPGEGIAQGTWHVNEDTLILAVDVPRKEAILKQSFNKELQGQRLAFKVVDRDTMPIDSGKVLINKNKVYWTDEKGQINLDSGTIEQIEIENPFIQKTAFVIKANGDNTFSFYIPMGSTELIYQQPEKWLIEGKYLIPIWLKDGRYELTRDRAIKKVSKRKIVPELK